MYSGAQISGIHDLTAATDLLTQGSPLSTVINSAFYEHFCTFLFHTFFCCVMLHQYRTSHASDIFSFCYNLGSSRILSLLQILERIVSAFRFPSQLLARKNFARVSLAEGLLHVAKAHPQPTACPRGLFPVLCALRVGGGASLVPRHLPQRWPSCASILHTTRGQTEK